MDASTIRDLTKEEILLALQETHPGERREIVFNNITGECLYSNDNGASGDPLCSDLMGQLIQDRLKKKHGVKVSLERITYTWNTLFAAAPKVDPFLSYISNLKVTDDIPYQDEFIELFSITPADKNMNRLRGAVTDLFQSAIIRAEGNTHWFPGNVMVIDCPNEDVRYSVHLLLTYLGRFGQFNGHRRLKQSAVECLGIKQYKSKYYNNGKILELHFDWDIHNVSRDGIFNNLQNLAISKGKDWYPVITTIKGRGFKTLETDSWRYFKVYCDDIAYDEVISANKEEVMKIIDGMWAKAYRQDRSEYVKLRPNYSQLHNPVMKQKFEEFTKATYSGMAEM